MSSKRHIVVDYAEESSCTDEEEEMENMDMRLEEKLCARPIIGGPRKSGLATNSSMEIVIKEGSLRRRGRGPSKRPCLNKNALMARENRQRKKEYIEHVENRLQYYQRENQELNNTIKKQTIEIERLANEVAYLKTVLKNNTIITSLLEAMNDSLKNMHGNNNNSAAAASAINVNSFDKQSINIANWIASEQFTSPKERSTNKDSLEFSKEGIKKSSLGQLNNVIKIARKTIPLTDMSSNPSSVKRISEEVENVLTQKSSKSVSHCEYNTIRSSIGLDNQLPTTPMSIISNSLDKGEDSLSDTNFSQLSSFHFDLFENFDEVTNPLQLEQDNSDIYSENNLFCTLEKDTSTVKLNEKTLFNSLINTGVCLHVNSCKVSLEFCSICHSNSLNSENV